MTNKPKMVISRSPIVIKEPSCGPQVGSKLPQCCPKVVSRMSQSCPKIVPKLSQSCPKGLIVSVISIYHWLFLIWSQVVSKCCPCSWQVASKDKGLGFGVMAKGGVIFLSNFIPSHHNLFNPIFQVAFKFQSVAMSRTYLATTPSSALRRPVRLTWEHAVKLTMLTECVLVVWKTGSHHFLAMVNLNNNLALFPVYPFHKSWPCGFFHKRICVSV